ncbi:MAG: peptide-methionine (S)-S-oxide reductase MsrA [Bacteroidales bacterium]|nr:peptide-methionine (S)-S-oxide reductase MsrA [Candidatus Cacconaster scatequi]
MNIIKYRKSLTVTATVLFGLALVINFVDYFTLAQPERNLLLFLLKTGCWIAAPVCLIVSMKESKKNRYRDIYFAGGCFWGTDTDTTGYVETVHVKYDTTVTSLRKLTEFYFKAIDPTSVNQQGEDKGTRYRTGVYYIDDNQKDAFFLKKIFEEQARIYGPLAVELLPLKNFVRAEEYHQDYLDKNPDGYCHLTPELFEYARK